MKIRQNESKKLISEKETDNMLENIQTELDMAITELYCI